MSLLDSQLDHATDIARRRVASIALGTLLAIVVIGLHPWSHAIKATGVRATGDGDVVRQLSYTALFIIVIIGLGVHRRPSLALQFPLNIAIILGWCWISLFWSIAPSIAIRRLALTTLIVWTAFFTVRQAGYKRTILVVQIVLCLTLLLNYISIIFDQQAIHRAADVNDLGLIGDWRGIFMQKNFAGAVCAITILTFIFSPTRIPALLRVAVMLGSAYFLYKTHSKTSVGILLLSIVGGGMYMTYNPRYRAVFVPAMVSAAALILLLSQLLGGYLAALFDRPDSLTGRVQIWPVLLGYARDHWLLGTGYGSFWNVGDQSPVYTYSHGWVAQLGNGHNGYLDLLTQIGLPGVALAVLTLIAWPLASLLGSREIPRLHGALLIAVLIFCAGHNMTETSILDRDAILEVFLMIAVLLTDRSTRSTDESSKRRKRLDGGPGRRLSQRTHGRTLMREQTVGDA